MKKEDVIVVGGLFDFMQEMLVAFRCPHTVIRPSELEHIDLEPVGRKILLLNCHLMDRRFPGSIPPGDPPDEEEAKRGMALNFVTLDRRKILMVAGNPITQAFYEAAGITCQTVEFDELVKAAGAMGCMTGILERTFE